MRIRPDAERVEIHCPCGFREVLLRPTESDQAKALLFAVLKQHWDCAAR